MKRNFNVLLLTLLLLVVISAVAFAAEEVQFSFKHPNAKKVYIVGEFNSWNETGNPMVKTEPGLWEITLELEEGSYEYKFIADGQWYVDPEAEQTADDGFGGQNSVVVVGEDVAASSGSSLKLGGYVDAKVEQNLIKGSAGFDNPAFSTETWLKLSGTTFDDRLDVFTEVGIQRGAVNLNKNVRFKDMVADNVFVNQARLTYLGDYADLSYYYQGRIGNSQDFMDLWLDEDDDGKDLIGWNRAGLGLKTEWNDIEAQVIGLKRPNDQLIYGEAVWTPQDDLGIGAGLVYSSTPNTAFDSGYMNQLNGTVWGWYEVNDKIKLDGQVLVSRGDRDYRKVDYTFVMDKDGAGDGEIGQSGEYDDIAYAQVRGTFNDWNWDMNGDNEWNDYQEGYALDMEKQADGTWTLDLEVTPGEHIFKIALFDENKNHLGDMWGPHDGNAKTIVDAVSDEDTGIATGFAYFLRGTYDDEDYGTEVALKAVAPDVKNDVSSIGNDYFDVTTDSWYKVLPEVKLTLASKNSYSFDLKTKNEFMVKPGVEYEPGVEYIELLGAWYEHYLQSAEDKANKFGLDLEAAYLGLDLESNFTFDTDKQWELKNKLEGNIAAVDVDVELELELKNEYWGASAEVSKDILVDLTLEVNGSYNKDKKLEGGGELSWFFPNEISDDLRLYLDYTLKSEVDDDNAREIKEHKIAVGLKGDF